MSDTSTSTSTSASPRFMPASVVPWTVSHNHGADVYLEPQDDVALVRSDARPIIAAEFKKHENKWKRETRHISSPVDKYLHPSYARIIGLGWPAVRYILQSIQRQPGDWFYALRAITDASPVPNSAAGDVRRMTECWVNWGKERGVI